MNFLLFSVSRQGVVWLHLHQAMFPPPASRSVSLAR